MPAESLKEKSKRKSPKIPLERKKQISNVLYLVDNDEKWTKVIKYGMICVILSNFLIGIIRTIPVISDVVLQGFMVGEILITCVFALDLVLRIWTVNESPQFQEKRLPLVRYLLSGYGLLDSFAFLSLFFLLIFPAIPYFSTALQIIRIFTFFKIMRYFQAVDLIKTVIISKREELFMTFLLGLIILFFSSVCIFFAENKAQPDKYPNLFTSMYWAGITLATVGYGEIVPITPIGKIFTSILAFVGVALYALPISIMSSGFIEVNSRMNPKEENCPSCGKKIDYSKALVDADEYKKKLKLLALKKSKAKKSKTPSKKDAEITETEEKALPKKASKKSIAAVEPNKPEVKVAKKSTTKQDIKKTEEPVVKKSTPKPDVKKTEESVAKKSTSKPDVKKTEESVAKKSTSKPDVKKSEEKATKKSSEKAIREAVEPVSSDVAKVPSEVEGKYKQLQSKVYYLFEAKYASMFISRIISLFFIFVIGVYAVAIMMETTPEWYIGNELIVKQIETFAIMVFMIEYFIHLWTCTADDDFNGVVRGRLRYMVTPLALIDLFAILPFFVQLWFPSAAVFVAPFRFIVVFKIGHYTTILDTIWNIMLERKNELFSALLIGIGIWVMVGTGMYYAERIAQPTVFTSIPASLWWAIITLSTIGYGDMYPITTPGRILAVSTALYGAMFFSLPGGIIGAGFFDQVSTQRRYRICPSCGYLLRKMKFQTNYQPIEKGE